MNSAPPHSKMVERIRKLLKLAGNNPNAHEAQAAKAKAEALMKENRISDADVREPVNQPPPHFDPFGRYTASDHSDYYYNINYYKASPDTERAWSEFKPQAEETYKQQQAEKARKTAAAADDAQLKACRQMIADIEKQKASLKSVWHYLNGQLKVVREAHDKRYKEL